MHLVGNTEMDFFSISNLNEVCDATAAFSPHPESPVRFVQYREQLEPVQTRTYLGPCPAEENTFAYLNSSIAGRVFKGAFVYNCTTEDYIPDGSLAVVPHSRDQTCVFSARLRREHLPGQMLTESLVSGAVFKYKQLVSHGFQTDFTFILSVHPMVNVTVFTTSTAAAWNAQYEGVLFYFSVFNGPSMISTSSESLPKNGLFVGVSVRGISVIRTREDGSSQLLAQSSTDAYPELVSEFEHHMHVAFAVDFAPEEMYGGVTIEPSYHSELKTARRLGLLTVSLDGRRVLGTILDLGALVKVDSVSTFNETSPGYDEPRPGYASVGFLVPPAATKLDGALPSVDVVAWDFRPTARCPGDSSDMAVCRVDAASDSDVQFRVRNIGQTRISLGVKYSSSSGTLPLRCGNSQLDWDQQHAYFLGCEREVQLSALAHELWISDEAQQRSLVVPLTTSEFRQDGTSGVFKRRSEARYCVVEHAHDLFRFYFAQCDCEYCARVFDLMPLYALFKSQMCGARFGQVCNCFEASQMTDQPYVSPWQMMEPVGGLNVGQPLLSFQKHTVCVGCKFDSHCNLMFKEGLCVGNSAQQYRIGNPLVPDIYNPGFHNWSRDAGRVQDGLIKGDVCDCQDGKGQVSMYYNTRGVLVTNEVYLIRTLQGSQQACFDCLELFEGSYCAVECGPSTSVSFLSHPNGQGCATCALSGVRLFELNYLDQSLVIDCFYEATAAGVDPWAHCQDTAKSMPPIYATTTDLFNGVATHFLTECPGRDFDDFGAVCVPNVQASNFLGSQILSRFSAMRDTVWSEDFTCMNAACNLVSRSKCYERLVHLNFSNTVSGSPVCTDLVGSGIQCHFQNGPSSTAQGLLLNKTEMQYGYTDPLPADLDLLGMGKTLEVWTSIDASDEVMDVANDAFSRLGPSIASASSLWVQDYSESKAFDGDLVTFWASSVSAVPDFESVLQIDLGTVQYVGSIEIHWQDYAIDFSIEATSDDITWDLLGDFTGNSANVTVISDFIAARKLRLTMTKASGVRGPGPNAGMYIYGVKEMIVLKDLIISHLRPVSTAQGVGPEYRISNAIDGDITTRFLLPFGWQTAGNAADIMLSFPAAQSIDSVVFLFTDLLETATFAFRGFTPDGATKTSVTCSFTTSAPTSCSVAIVIPRGSAMVFNFGQRILLEAVDVSIPASAVGVVGIWEIAAYGKQRLRPFAGSASSSSNPTAATNAVDGNSKTFWSTGSVFPASLLIDTVTCESVDAVDVQLSAITGAISMTISTSEDCEVFTPAGTLSLTSSSSASLVSAGVTASCVRCVQLAFASSASASAQLAEVYLVRTNAAAAQSIISTFTSAEFAFDGDSTTAAVGSPVTTNSLQMLIMTDLGEPRNVWGYSVEFMSGLAAENITFSYCANSMVLSSCVWQQMHRLTGLARTGDPVSVTLPEVAPAFGVLMEFESSVELDPIQVAQIAVFDGPNVVPEFADLTSSQGFWSHPATAVVDGSSLSLYVVNGNLSDSVVIELNPDLTTSVFAQNVTIEFDAFNHKIARNFSVLHSVDGVSYSSIATVTNHVGVEYFTDLKAFCNFVKIAVDPVAAVSGETPSGEFGRSFGVREVIVKMSSSAQVGRSFWAQSTADAAAYSPEKAIDGDEHTIFLHNPGKLPSLTEFRLPRTLAVSGILFKWMNVPYNYSVEYAEESLLTGVKVWSTATEFEAVGSDSIFFEQSMREGFTAQFFRLNISDVKPYLTAPVAALRELVVYTPSYPCDRTTCPCCFQNLQTSDYSISPNRAFDGDFTTFWRTDASGASMTATIAGRLSGTRIGKLEITWGTLAPKKFQLIIDTAEGYRLDDLVFDNNRDLYFEKLLMYEVDMLTVMLLEAWPGDTSFQITEIVVWAAGTDVQPAGVVQNLDHEFTASIGNAIDLTDSFWMSQPGDVPGTSILDLGEVCKVIGFQIVWSLRPTFYNDDVFSFSVDGVDWIPLYTEIRPTQPEIEEFDGEFELRYLRIYLTSSYTDETSSTQPVWSVGIRNIELKIDTNLAKNGVPLAPLGSWEFAPARAFDGDASTYWMSRFGARESTLTIDLGEDMNMAGVEVEMAYRAKYVEWFTSSGPDCSTTSYKTMYSVSGNVEYTVEVPSTIHVRARCVRALLQLPLDVIEDPQGGEPRGVLGVKRFSIFDHKGGGGVFGLELCEEGGLNCGRRFDAIVYGLTQPRRWEMASEEFSRTQEIKNVKTVERTSELVHMVAVFDNSTVTMYRNGVIYGEAYTHTSTHVTTPASSQFLRLVFGVRSSVFIGESTIGEYSDDVRTIAGPKTSQSQYYSGVIKSVSLIKGAALAEEVLGLYEAGLNGGSERSCHCADACPFGFNNMYPDIPVPCSGQGVCRRDPADIHGGYCQCAPGFSGEACGSHCSDLGGCCNAEDDCEPSRTCDLVLHACVPAS